MQELISIPNSALYLKKRNEAANAVIERYARHHHLLDISCGSIAKLFLSGGAPLAMLAPIANQAPFIYQPLIQELSHIYSATPEMIVRESITNPTLNTTGQALVEGLSLEFGSEFIQDLLYEIWLEAGRETAVDLLPIIGEIVFTVLGTTLSTTLIWQISTMTAMYFLNNETWVTSKQETRLRARKQTGLPSPNTRRPEVLIGIPHKNPEIREKITHGVNLAIQLLKKRNPAITHEQLRLLLKKQGIADEFIEI